MKSINKIRWRKRAHADEELNLLRTWNPNLGIYIKNNSPNLRKCVEEIYAKIFDGAIFPFEQEVYKKPECLNERPSHIKI